MTQPNFYKHLTLLVSFSILGVSSAFAQLELKLQLMPDTLTWGVYVTPNGVSPTTNTITGSGQVTFVAPTGFSYTNLTNSSGQWIENARVNQPTENSTFDYISFGFVTDAPIIQYQSGEETLLFTIERVGNCPDTLYLIDNATDLFNVLPNSAGTNPGNDLSVIDIGDGGTLYNYSGNYAPSAWSCQDCDGDGILNAIEDTNGNGTFDVGVDSSGICDICDPIHPQAAVITGDTTICETVSTELFVNILNGWPPYTVVYNDGTSDITVNTYTSDDPIVVTPLSTTTYTLVSITDINNCVAHPDSLSGSAHVIVEGAITITSDPVDVSECSGNGTSFTSLSNNGGDGTIQNQWQISTDNGSTWTDLPDGTPYSDATTSTLNISDVAGLHGNQYRLRISTDACGDVFSAAATLSVEGPVTIDSNPSDVTLCSGDATSFTSGATNAGAGTLALVWQISTDNGSTWTDLTNVAPYSNVTTATLNISDIAGLGGNMYRMGASTSECVSLFSDAALLTVEGPLTINTHPQDVADCAGDAVVFTVGVDNPGAGTLMYQWQLSTDNGSTWSSINDDAIYNGTDSDTLSVSDVQGLDGNQYQVVISTATCNIITSNAATLTIDGPITYTAHPDDVIECSGNATSFNGAATIAQGSITYQWQISTDGGTTWTDLTNTSPYSGADTGTLSISDVAGLSGNLYRVNAVTATCDPVPSLVAELLVEGPLSVDVHPADITECSGDNTSFSTTINNPGEGSVLYNWQISTDNGSNFVNLSNNSIYNGVSTNTLSITNVAGMYDYQFRVAVSTSTCSIIYTNAAVLTVEGVITVTTDPDDVTICSGEATSFTAAATNDGSGSMVYQWQLTTDGINWADVPDNAVYDDVTTTTLVVNDVTGLGGRCYRMQTSTGVCNEVNTASACLIVEGPIAITTEPQDVTQCSAEPAIFTTEISNGGSGDLIYQWQVTTNGSTWNNIDNGDNYNGATTDTLSVSDVAGLGGNEYRVIISTGTCASLTSASATLTVEGPLEFIDQPDDITECSGGEVTFQATLSNGGAGTAVFHWEVSTDGGLTWTDLTVGAPYTGVNSPVLVINPITGLGDNQYRCVASTSTCVDVPSQAATLTVEGPITLDTQPTSVIECSGEGTSFSVTASNLGSGAIDFQWQVSTDAGSNYVNLSNNSIYNGATSSTLSIANVAGLDDNLYRVIIQTGTCSSVTSNAVSLDVEGPITYTAMPQDVVMCSGGGTTFSSAVTNSGDGTLGYQWQVSTDGINWADLTNSAPYSDVTTLTLSISDVAGLTGRLYRMQTTTGTCDPISSDPALLTVEGPLSITTQPVDFTTCSDLGVFYTVDVDNQGEGFIFYQWQESTDGGSTWNDLLNQGNYNGVSTDTLSIDLVTGMYDNQYHVLIWTESCGQITSSAAGLTVEGPLTVTNEPDDVTICSGTGTSFEVTVTNAGAGTMAYQWEVSTNGGATWSNLSNVAPYSGADLTTLTISDVAGLGGYKYRCQINTPNCAETTSTSATLTVEGPINISTQPDDAAVCSNIGHTFSAVISNGGAGVMSLQWQESTDGGSTWNNITNGGNYNGVTTQDLGIVLVESLDAAQYRIVISSSVCNLMTNEVTLSVLDACSEGGCDFDLDGLDNDTDLDDDNDQLSDYYEDWMTTHNITDGWNYTDNTGGLLTYSRCDSDSDNDGILDGQEDPDMDDIKNEEETDGDGVFDGNPLDPCDPVLSSNCIGIELDLRVILQGAMINAPDTLMRDDLRSQGIIPTTEPYTDITEFEHVGGGGGETISSTVLDVTGEDAIVDWVFVELRSSIDLDSVIATRSCLLQRDGDIVDLDGVSNLIYNNTVAGPYYVAVRHRNHLGVMTNDAGELSPIVTTFNFTDTSYVSLGTNPQIEISGRNYMWAGDLNSDGKSIYQGPGNDIFSLLQTVLSDSGNTDLLSNYISTGYAATDIDLDGDSIYQGPFNDRAVLLFNIILQYPENGSALANYVILQQLP